jgi:erythromycin esterase-like protein
MVGGEGACDAGAQATFDELAKLYQSGLTKPQQREEVFSAWQNARVIKNAAGYYRASYSGETSSWNLRDTHMADTVDAIAAHLGTQGSAPSGVAPGAKVIIWAHNSHVGDARQTTMGESGEITLGQLMRQRHPNETFLLGFTTNTGTVMAASSWGGEGQVKRVLPALPGSFASLFHQSGIPRFLLPLRGEGEFVLAMGEPRLERAIGVLYLPQTERESHYFQARMSKQFDAVIHIDTTRALEPLQSP